MNGNVEEEPTRPRPQSAGIWTLFSWLRRSDHSSSESISSVGSDRTAASFDFLAPLQYRLNNPPLILPSSPPTDTYKKRLHDRNVRRLRDQDTSIHRKYGLLRVDEARYDTFDLTATFSNKSSYCKTEQGLRERRATSECIHRRAAYVPGKRRAPQPPLPVVAAATLPRSYKRKRPAPKPPTAIVDGNKENFVFNKLLRMNNKTSVDRDIRSLRSTSCVQKSDASNVPEQSKDKSFLKQIFVNRKRNSVIDTSHIKFLPSISELDKQALEIIQRKKALEADGTKCDNLIPNSERTRDNVWICTSCLRRYTTTITSCVYCIAENRRTKRISMDVSNIQTQTDANASVSKKSADKEKLKEMLKEMKDSLPKRSKHHVNKNDKTISESSTLRIGSNTTETADLSSSSKDSDKVQGSKITKMSHEKEKFFNLKPSSSKFLDATNINKSSNQLFSKVTSNTGPRQAKFLDSDNVSINMKDKVNVERDMNNAEIPNNDVKSSETKIVKMPIEKICLHEEKKNQPTIKPPLSTLLVTSPNPQLPKSNINDNIKPVSSNLLHQIETASIKINSTVNSNIAYTDNKNSPKTINNTESTKPSAVSKQNIPLHTPLKISALLNPLYNPKHNSNEQNIKLTDQSELKGTTPIPLPGCSKFTATPRSHPSTQNFYKTVITNSGIDDKLSTKLKQEINPPSKNKQQAATASGSSEITAETFNPYSRRRMLITQLEQSIAKGDEKTASDVAAKLAKLKLSCSVLSFSSQIVADSVLMFKDNESFPNRHPDIIKDIGEQNNNGLCKAEALSCGTQNDYERVERNSNNHLGNKTDRNVTTQEKPSTSGLETNNNIVAIEVWIEDKETTRGPIRLRVSRESTMKELMQQAEISLGLAIQLQRWIVGKTLCTDNNVSLSALAGPDLASPFYLCLVESDTVKKEISTVVKIDDSKQRNVQTKINANTDGVYTELMRLEKEAIVPNLDPFECAVCMENRAVGEGIVLRECLHVFCRECLADAARHCEEPVVSCPEVGCSGTLQERELRALLSVEEYEKWLARSLTAAESGTRNTFHCRTKDCKGWAFCEPGVRKFPCPVCKCINCLECQAVHEGKTCKQYQEELQKAVAGENNQTDEGTKAFLNSLISRGEALECPECQAIITKKWGCDWIKCSACKTEICWVTRGRRWGLGGRGDTSAGCRCGVDGQRCHPSCGYCH